MNQQAIREAFENAVDTYHIYGEVSLVTYCRRLKLSGQLTPIEDSLIRAYDHNCGNVGKRRAWINLMYEFNLNYLETIAIRYFGYNPKEHINE